MAVITTMLAVLIVLVIMLILLVEYVYFTLSKDMRKIKSYIWAAHWKGVHKVEETEESIIAEVKNDCKKK